MLSPKREGIHNLNGNCTLYHVIQKHDGIWQFERRQTDSVRTGSMLGRVTVGKVSHKAVIRVQEILADPNRIRVHDPNWDLEMWVEEAISDLVHAGVLQTRVSIDVPHLMKYARQQSNEVLKRGLNAGYRLPPTSEYPGPIP